MDRTSAINKHWKYLCVKRVQLELVGALEGFRVNLAKIYLDHFSWKPHVQFGWDYWVLKKTISVRKPYQHRPHLLKRDSVELSLEDVDFFHIVIFAPDKVALPGQGQLCVFGPLGRLVLLRVVEHKERNPESLNILEGEGVLWTSPFEVEVLDTVVIPSISAGC